MTDKFATSSQEREGDLTLPLTLLPGDTITDCCTLWLAGERMADELNRCNACGRRTFRIVTITSSTRTKRQAALCGTHLLASAQLFPALWSGQLKNMA
jgi:hypothetical protein